MKTISARCVSTQTHVRTITNKNGEVHRTVERHKIVREIEITLDEETEMCYNLLMSLVKE